MTADCIDADTGAWPSDFGAGLGIAPHHTLLGKTQELQR